MTEPKGFASLKAFVESIQSAKHAMFSVKPESKVANEGAFADMQAHILSLYEKTEALHSFMDESGAVYDCIPVEQQPSLRGLKGRVPVAPDAPQLEAVGGPKAKHEDILAVSPLGLDKKDRFGNVMHCPEGAIPMRRVTMEDLTQFGTLRDFFRKGPRGAGRPPRESEPSTVPATHRWAHAFQNVINGGGHSFLNLWNPQIGAGQVFSLSQHWYVGGSGANLQTLECGWQVYPAMYGDTKPHLFTYWTADDYNKTGCYSLTCNAFVQTSNVIAPGMAIGPTSVVGGQQYEIELTYWHTGGRWWLYFNGTLGSNAIGYYPDSIYKGGCLAKNASEIDYGGETVGTTTFPPMGSGHFAAEGWQKAAYQRTIGYYKPAGGAMVNASLTPSQQWPKCYTAIVQMYAAPWLETLWYGGPGGIC
jgi:hypothetical protein